MCVQSTQGELASKRKEFEHYKNRAQTEMAISLQARRASLSSLSLASLSSLSRASLPLTLTSASDALTNKYINNHVRSRGSAVKRQGILCMRYGPHDCKKRVD